jgi:hypothetical protein
VIEPLPSKPVGLGLISSTIELNNKSKKNKKIFQKLYRICSQLGHWLRVAWATGKRFVFV